MLEIIFIRKENNNSIMILSVSAACAFLVN